MTETTATEVLSMDMFCNVTHECIEVFDERIMLIPVEEVDNRNVSFGTDIDRESTSSCVVVEAEDVNREGQISFDCGNICRFHRIVNCVEVMFREMPSVGVSIVMIVSTWF